jgi:hypothetical protein
MPAITTIVNTINHVIGSEIREVKTLQETSEMQIRDDLMDFKTHMREVETLQRSIADRNQADSQAQLQRQAELQHSVGALHDYLETRLDLLLQEKIEEPISRGPNSMINYSQMLLGVVQVIGSGIASGIGAMAALSSHMSTTRSDQGRSSMAPYQIASPAIHPPYEDAWENAYKAAENEFAKHSSSHSVGARCTRTAGTSSSDSVTYRLPILMGWRKCHVCAREIDRALHGDKCPDCEHEMCDECTDVQLTDTSDTWGSDRTISFPAKKPNEERINVKDSSLQ